MQPSLLSGAKVEILIGDKIVAAAFVADYSIETKGMEIEALDSVFPIEIAPDRIRVSMNLKVYRTPDNDPVLDKFTPGANALGQTEQSAFTQSRYISLKVRDNYKNNIMTFPKAWITRRSGSVQVGDFLTENWAVLAIGYYGPQS